MKPLLNRLVFHGIHTCRGKLDSTSARVRLPGTDSVTLYALATTALERMSPELLAAGFARTRRTVHDEEWRYGDVVRLVLAPVSGADAEAPDSVAREYAVLLTDTLLLADDCAVRVSAPATQVALFWRAYEFSGVPMMESEWIEDMIELVVRRTGIIDEVGAAPVELRAIVAQVATQFLASDSSRWVLRRSLPDARQVPAYAERMRERFVRLAAPAPGV